ncbi:MAG: hypothetical protein ACFFC7_25375 [Candidatus Hermodarchaeota archaeon]
MVNSEEVVSSKRFVLAIGAFLLLEGIILVILGLSGILEFVIVLFGGLLGIFGIIFMVIIHYLLSPITMDERTVKIAYKAGYHSFIVALVLVVQLSIVNWFIGIPTQLAILCILWGGSFTFVLSVIAQNYKVI